MIYTLESKQFLPIGLDAAWDFFSSPANLSKITPPEMKFVVLTKLGKEPIFSGMKIDYTIRPLLNVPLKWTTLITDVDAPFSFVDRQEKGPYKLWEHTHRFMEVPGGIRMTDTVRYALPFGFLGRLAHAMIVKKKLAGIFHYRTNRLEQLFGKFKQ